MEINQVWLKTRQDDSKSRFFAIKKWTKRGSNLGFDMATSSKGDKEIWNEGFISKVDLEGFEKRNKLLTIEEIAKYILLNELNTIIL